MAETNISADKTTGQTIQAEHVNELKSAIITTLSGRNSSGNLAPGQQLGSNAYPWGTAYINNIISNGNLIDFSGLAVTTDRIISGKQRSTSTQADFIRAAGSSNNATIEGATTALNLVINGATVEISADIALSALTTASGGASNRCNINDPGLADQEFTKYLGGENDPIPVDTMGANMLTKIGQMVALLSTNGEYMLALLKSSTQVAVVRRGFFFDDNGDPIVRQTLANDDTLSLMSLGFVFVDSDGSTTDVSYLTPIYDFNEPNSPATGQYWFDTQEQTWKRYDGVNFINVDRILIGLVVIDTSNCVASRSFGFAKDFSDLNSISFNPDGFTDTTIFTKDIDNIISVNSKEVLFRYDQLTFDITDDLASGVIEAANTTYYCYLSEEGQKIIDTERPYRYNPFIQGYYHPYNTWRCVGSFDNDGSSDIESVIDIDELIDPNTKLVIAGSGELTISSGAITITGSQHTVRSEVTSSADNLDTINRGVTGQIVVLSAGASDEPITLRHNIGNIITPTGANITLSNTNQRARLQYDGTNYIFLDIKLPGDIVQIVNTTVSTVASHSSAIPSDNTIPQSNEGGEAMTLSITPTSANNKLFIQSITNIHEGSTSPTTVALFQNSIANALAAVGAGDADGSSGPSAVPLNHYMTANTTISTTFKIRYGTNSGSQTTFNGVSGSARFGGVASSSITIMEIQT